MFCRPFFVLYISFGHCVFCPSSIYHIWSPFWFLQTVLASECCLIRSWNRILFEPSSICVLGVSMLSLSMMCLLLQCGIFSLHFKFWLQEIDKHVMSNKCLPTDDSCLHTRFSKEFMFYYVMYSVLHILVFNMLSISHDACVV